MNQLRIALLGTAYPHADFWVRGWKAMPQVSLVGVWDQDAERGKRFAAEHGFPYVDSLDGVLGSTQVDAVGIGSENAYHAHLSIAALQHGKHVLCDKPMATTLEDCDAVVETLNHSNVRYMAAFPMRYDPNNLVVRQLLRDGVIGEVSSLHKRHGLGWATEPVHPEGWLWFADPGLSGGGAFLDEGVHAADYVRWLLGDPVSVTAHIATVQSPFHIDDNGIAVYHYSNGAHATIEASWIWRASHHTTTIYGYDGTIIQGLTDLASTAVLSDVSQPVQVYSRTMPERGWWRPYPMKPLHFMRAHDEVAIMFASGLLGCDVDWPTAQDGRKALELVLAAYTASETGCKVELPTGIGS